MTFRARDWLATNLGAEASVFEYGAGGSTLFFSRRARSVVSVEHDKEFYELIRGILSSEGLSNCTLALREPEAIDPGIPVRYEAGSFTSFQRKYQGCRFERYVKYIDQFPEEAFDIVLVDGRSRLSAVARAINKVRRPGFVMLDNSDRPGYAGVAELLGDFERKDMFGVSPWNMEPGQTTVWTIA